MFPKKTLRCLGQVFFVLETLAYKHNIRIILSSIIDSIKSL